MWPSHRNEARTLFSLMAGLSFPSMSLCAALVNSAKPAIGRYSWFRSGSLRRISSACLHEFTLAFISNIICSHSKQKNVSPLSSPFPQPNPKTCFTTTPSSSQPPPLSPIIKPPNTRQNKSKSHLLNNRQNPRLRIIIPISPNAQIDLLRILILPISSHEPEQRVLRRLGDDVRREGRWVAHFGCLRDVGFDGLETVLRGIGIGICGGVGVVVVVGWR